MSEQGDKPQNGQPQDSGKILPDALEEFGEPIDDRLVFAVFIGAVALLVAVIVTVTTTVCYLTRSEKWTTTPQTPKCSESKNSTDSITCKRTTTPKVVIV